MAKFLSAVGRSNLAATGKDLLKQAYDIQATRTQGAKDVLAATINVGDFKQRQAESQRQEAAVAREAKKYEENEAYMNAYVPLEDTLDFNFGPGDSPSKTMAREAALAGGAEPDPSRPGKNVITRRYGHQLTEEMSKSLEFKKLYFADLREGYDNVAVNIRNKLAKLSEDPEKNAEAIAELNKQLDVINKSSEFALQEDIKNENDRKLQELKNEGAADTARIAAESRKTVAGMTTDKPVYNERDARKRRTALTNMKIKLVAGVGEFSSTGNSGAMQAMVEGILKKNPVYAEEMKLAEAAEAMTVEAFQSAISNITDEIAYVNRYIPKIAQEQAPKPSNVNTLYGTTEQEAQAMESALGPGVDIPTRPRGIPEGSFFIETRDGYDYWTNPNDPTKVFEVVP